MSDEREAKSVSRRIGDKLNALRQNRHAAPDHRAKGWVTHTLPLSLCSRASSSPWGELSYSILAIAISHVSRTSTCASVKYF